MFDVTSTLSRILLARYCMSTQFLLLIIEGRLLMQIVWPQPNEQHSHLPT